MITGIAPFVGGSLSGAGSAGGLSSVLSGLGTAGEFAGAVGGFFGGGEKRPRYEPYIRALVGPGNYDKGVNTLAKANAWAEETMFNSRMKLAKQHGISKLAMLGVPFAPSSPMVVGGGGLDRDFGALGQNLGRAAGALAGRGERAMQAMLTSLQVEGAQLDNDYKRSLIALNLKQAGHPPGISGGVNVVPKEVVDRDGRFEKGVSAFEQVFDSGTPIGIRGLSSAGADAGLEDGPANWYYQLTRTVPDMIASDVYDVYRNARNWFRRR